MSLLPANFRELPIKAKHEALRDLHWSKAEAMAEDDPRRPGREEMALDEDDYVKAIGRQQKRCAV
jgi:hypothetical protein